MYERRSAAIVAMTSLCLAMGHGAPLAAQSHQADEAALVRHLDSILPLYREAERAARAEESRVEAEQKALAVAQGPRLDTIDVGPLRVVTLPGQADLARRFFTDAFRSFRPVVGDGAAFRHALFTFQWSVKFEAIPVEGNVYRVELRRWDLARAVESRTRAAIGEALRDDLSSTRTGRTWGSAPIRPTPDPAAIYRELATTRANPNESCLAGAAHSCAVALGLDVKPGAWRSWFTPAEKREMVARAFAWDTGDRARQRTCLDGADSACDRIVAVMFAPARGGRIHGTLSSEARGSLLWLALERGGEGAWARLLHDPDASPEEALAEASGLQVDELCAAWRGWVLAHRPDEAASLSAGILSATFWILLFAALALRSTRWRSG